MASVHLDGTVSTESGRSGLPIWVVVAASVAFGMGIAMAPPQS